MVLGGDKRQVWVVGGELVYLRLDRPPQQAPVLPYRPSGQVSRRGDEACPKRDGDGFAGRFQDSLEVWVMGDGVLGDGYGCGCGRGRGFDSC